MNQTLIITVFFLLIPLGTVAQTAGTKPEAATNHSVQLALEKLVDEYARPPKRETQHFLRKTLPATTLALKRTVT